MAHAVTGKAGAASVAGGALNALITEWRWRLFNTQAVDTHCTLTFESRVATFGDWEAEITAFVPDQAGRHFFAVNESTMTTPSTVVIELKQKSGDTNPVFSGTGIAESLEQVKPLREGIEFRARVICSEGTAPTIDTTPA